MLLKFLCLSLMWHEGLAEDLVSVLSGAGAGRRGVALCLGAARGECAGALWRRQWVVTRASCLQRAPLHQVRATSGDATCQDFDKGLKLPQAGNVLTCFVHPQYGVARGADLALVVTDRAGSARAPALPPNASAIHHLLHEFEPWMEDMYLKYPSGPRKVSYEHTYRLFSSPLRMFLTTVVLPSLSFMVFFLFVIFFTGPKEDISYKSIEEEKTEDTQLGV